MSTIWDILTGKAKSQESKVTNLRLRIGGKQPSILAIEGGEFAGLRFAVSEIRELVSEKPSLIITDYDLIARDLESNITKLRLRLCPLKNPDGEITHDVVVLKLYSEFGYNQEFFDLLNENAGNEDDPDLYCNDDNSQWWRVNDMETPWDINLTTLADSDHSGKVDPNEVVKSQLTFWDYWRQNDSANPPITEMLFVEMDENHFFQNWRGIKTDPRRIQVLA